MNKDFWKAAGIRALRTFIQVILAVWTAGQLITEVDWKFLLLSAFSSAVYSLLTSILSGLPEVPVAVEMTEEDGLRAIEESEYIQRELEAIEDDELIEGGEYDV